jgi:hypothetical protein
VGYDLRIFMGIKVITAISIRSCMGGEVKGARLHMVTSYYYVITSHGKDGMRNLRLKKF